MGNLKDNGFHVKLDGVELSDASSKRIQAGIREVVLRELAGYYPNPDDDTGSVHFGQGVIVVPPRFWRGYILRQLDRGEALQIKGLENEINSKQYETGGFR
jgi:hypothetical protein